MHVDRVREVYLHMKSEDEKNKFITAFNEAIAKGKDCQYLAEIFCVSKKTIQRWCKINGLESKLIDGRIVNSLKSEEFLYQYQKAKEEHKSNDELAEMLNIHPSHARTKCRQYNIPPLRSSKWGGPRQGAGRKKGTRIIDPLLNQYQGDQNSNSIEVRIFKHRINDNDIFNYARSQYSLTKENSYKRKTNVSELPEILYYQIDPSTNWPKAPRRK